MLLFILNTDFRSLLVLVLDEQIILYNQCVSFSTVAYFVNSLIITYFISMPRLSINLTTSVMHTAVVEKYSSPDGMVLVYRRATVYAAATSVITVRQYTLKTTLTFSEEKQGEHFTVEQITKPTGHYCCVT